MKPYIYNVMGGEFYFSDTALTKGEWHRLEMKYSVSNTSGRAELWVDGVKKVDESNKDTGTELIERTQIGIFWKTSGEETVYIDESFDKLWVDPEPITSLNTESLSNFPLLISSYLKS